MRPNALRLVLLVVVPIAIAVAAGLFWLWGGRYVSTENAYVKSDIVQIAAEVSGKVIAVNVKDHAAVTVGELLIRIDTKPFELALAKADAELDATRQRVETLKAAWGEAQSELAEALTRLAYFRQQADRQSKLAKRGIVSASRMDAVDNDRRVAADRVQVVRNKIKRVLAAISGKPKLPVDQHPLVREKLALRDAAKLDLTRTRIVAPVDGIAVNMKLQPGEQIKAQTPLFALVSKIRPWVEANFKETDLTHVRVGHKATVVLDIYPDITWEAEVISISPATGAEFAILPPQNASGNWVKVVQRLPVKLKLLPRSGQDPPLRAGMTATVDIDTERVRRLADFLGKGKAVAMRNGGAKQPAAN